MLKIPLRSHEADRTEKASLASRELSYSNFTALMELSQGSLGCKPNTDEIPSFLMKIKNFLVQNEP